MSDRPADSDPAALKRWGVGPPLAFCMIGYAAIVVLLRLTHPGQFAIRFVPYWVLAAAGAVLVLAGVVFYVPGVRAVRRARREGRLCTRGVFAACRHPIYAAWALLIFPGLMLLADSWPALAGLPLIYAVLRLAVRQEERRLARRFPDAYRAYKRSVPAIFPYGWLRRRRRP